MIKLLIILMTLLVDPAAAPVVELPADRTIDLGLIDRDSIHEGSIVLRNGGNAPLAITNVFADCSCAVPRYPREAIAPGDSAVITVRFDGRDYPPGAFLKMLKVRSNATNRLVKIFVKGTIRRPANK